MSQPYETDLRRFSTHERTIDLEIGSLTEIAETSIEAALDSARIVRNAFYGKPLSDLQIDWKEDATPRTIADVEGDLAIARRTKLPSTISRGVYGLSI